MCKHWPRMNSLIKKLAIIISWNDQAIQNWKRWRISFLRCRSIVYNHSCYEDNRLYIYIYICHEIYVKEVLKTICKESIFKKILIKLSSNCIFSVNNKLIKPVIGCPISVSSQWLFLAYAQNRTWLLFNLEYINASLMIFALNVRQMEKMYYAML